MAGKKAAPKKKGPEAPKLSPEEELARTCAELESVRRLLEIRTHEASETRASERRWRDKAEECSRALAQAEKDTKDMSEDMARTTKGMQEQSQKKAADLERQLAGLQRELGERDAEVAALKRAQQGAVEQQAVMAQDFSARLSQQQLQFQALLREALAAAQEKLDAAHSSAMLGQRTSLTPTAAAQLGP